MNSINFVNTENLKLYSYKFFKNPQLFSVHIAALH